MAKEPVHFDTSALQDAVDELLEAHEALAALHGEPYRALEARIDALVRKDLPGPEVHRLVGGPLMLSPPEEVQAILAEARRLGILRR